VRARPTETLSTRGTPSLRDGDSAWDLGASASAAVPFSVFEQRIAIDQIVRLRSSHIPEVRAKVRWRRGDEYGLVFEDTFQLAQFAHLAARLQSPSLITG